MSPIPPKALAAAGILIAASLALAAFGRLTGLGTVQAPPADIVRTMDIRFADADDGGILVMHDDGRLLTKLAPGTNGFIRGVVRSLGRARKLDRVKTDPALSLTLWSDHRLTLRDPATDESIDLTGFGRDNRGAFARLLAMNATMAEGRAP